MALAISVIEARGETQGLLVFGGSANAHGAICGTFANAARRYVAFAYALPLLAQE
jgi:hypothetical protein